MVFVAKLCNKKQLRMTQENFKAKSLQHWGHPVTTRTTDPYGRASKIIKGLPVGGKCMQISSWKSDVYVLRRKYAVMNMYDHDGINTPL